MKKLSFILFVPLVLMSLNKSCIGQWTSVVQFNNIGPFPRISVVDSNVVWAAGGSVNPVIYRTVNAGQNWKVIPVSGLPFRLASIAAKDSVTAFVCDFGSYGGGGNAKLFKTTNAGINWLLIDSTGSPDGFFDGIVFSKSLPDFGIALSENPAGSGLPFLLFRTEDSGHNWAITNPPGFSNFYGWSYTVFAIDPLFYGFMIVDISIYGCDSYITSNGGISWYRGGESVYQTGQGDIVFSDNKLSGIMISSNFLPNIKRTINGGTSWETVNTMNDIRQGATATWVTGTNTVFMCSISSVSLRNIFRSDDAGISWVSQNTSSVDKLFEIDYAKYSDLVVAYSVSSTGHVLKSRQSVQTIGIQQIGNSAPSAFSLSQNYPNPFNPKTIISYQISKSGNVSIKVYNVLGNEVATLADQEHDPGTYEVEFDGSDLTSGVYFYRIETESFTETKRMLMLK